jgi:hypothetical protein
MPRITVFCASALLASVLVGAAATASAQPDDFHAFLLPDTSLIAVGEIALVNFEVDATARQFNGYEVTIRWRSDIVEFLSFIEGPLMTGACGNTFVFPVQPNDSTLTLTHVILCGGVALDGPGVLSTYRFRGLVEGESPVTILSDPSCTFFDAGVCVNPSHPTFPRQVILHDATILVGEVAGIDPEESTLRPFRLELNAPNPFRPHTSLRFELGAAAQVRIEVMDVAGRRVWLREAALGAGRHAIDWKAIGADGAPLPSGTYFWRLVTPDGSATRKMTLAR